MRIRMKNIPNTRQKVHTDCRYYHGDRPCKPHKETEAHCDGCSQHDPVREKILIIKLGAIGDVIRTTPILHALKKAYPRAQIHWLTDTPEIIPDRVDRIFRYTLQNVEILLATRFHTVLNLDKDREACALARMIHARKKRGFILKNGHCHPADRKAFGKWITGLFDDENRRNTKSYPEEIFEMAGFTFKGEEYIIDVRSAKEWNIPKNKRIIGLNTGCGKRWQTRLWPDSSWAELIRLLDAEGFQAVLLGGEQEEERNRKLAENGHALYFGTFPLNDFIGLVGQCDVIITPVTMTMHIALGLKKQIVLFNNIFNAREFEMYGRGVILEPPVSCRGCFKNECHEKCMSLISPSEVMRQVTALAAKVK